MEEEAKQREEVEAMEVMEAEEMCTWRNYVAESRDSAISLQSSTKRYHSAQPDKWPILLAPVTEAKLIIWC